MNRTAALTLLIASLLTGKTAPQTENTVQLNVSVKCPESGCADTVLRIFDLCDGRVYEQKLEEEKAAVKIRRGGEYILALKNTPPGLMPKEEILITEQHSRKALERTFTLRPFEVRIHQYIDNTDLFAEGGILELRDEGDETVFEFEPDEEGYVKDEEGNEFLFTAGGTYVLSSKETPEGYEDTGDVLLLIPEYMEEDEPLEFEFFLKESDGTEQSVSPYVLPQGEYIHVPSVIHTPETADEIMEQTEEAETVEEILPVQTLPYVTQQPFVIPSVYLNEPEEKKESRKIESGIERTGFIVRLLDENNEYLKGAKLAVYDQNRRVVDEWETGSEDHLVSGTQIRASETYTVHMISPAAGYSASVVDIQHTATAVRNENYPLIELNDRPKKAAPKPEQKTETVKKTANKAVVASAIAAGGILTGIAAVFVIGRKTH